MGQESIRTRLHAATAADWDVEPFNAQDALNELGGRVRNVEWAVTDVKTANYTQSASGEVVRCDPSGGAFTITLNFAVTGSGFKVIVKNVTTSTNTITIDVRVGGTIDGVTTKTITTDHGWMRFISDGSEWMVVGSG